MDDEELHALECVACPSAGSCGGQFTANTMACVEAIGLAIPGSAGAPALMKRVMNMPIIRGVWSWNLSKQVSARVIF